MMRKLTASILGTAILAGGALTGVAAASPSHHEKTRTELQARDHRSSIDRAQRHERAQHHDRVERGR